ncbi:MAG: LysR family transcriptional regulator [Pseudomonadota bacterium]
MIFSQVAQAGSIRQAAERLGMSASSVSRQIARMEHELSVQLVLRNAQGIKLTPAGEILARFVQSRTREFERLKASITELERLERGHVSFACVEGMLGGFLPAAISEFSRKHPGITYEVTVMGADDVMAAVATHRCDFGIAFQPRPRPDVETIHRLPQPLLAVVAATHPLSTRGQLALWDLAPHPVGLPDQTFGIRNIVNRAMKAHGVVLRVRLETNSIDMVRQFALHGMGVAFLPHFAFAHAAGAGNLVGIPLKEREFAEASAQFCKSTQYELSLAARALLTAIVSASSDTCVLH